MKIIIRQQDYYCPLIDKMQTPSPEEYMIIIDSAKPKIKNAGNCTLKRGMQDTIWETCIPRLRKRGKVSEE
jgi:hypothetical protein